jgi:hypothetical protein
MRRVRRQSHRPEDAGFISPSFCTGINAMDDDAEGEMLRGQALRLIKTFLRITDSRKKKQVLDLAEQLAENAASAAAESDPAKTPPVEEYEDSPDRIE